MKKLIIASAIASIALTGCLDKNESEKSLEIQKKSCIFSLLEDAKKDCKEGDVAVFMPTRWGNEQIPIFVVSRFCDYRYQIIYNNSGMSCIFTDKRIDKKQDSTTQP